MRLRIFEKLMCLYLPSKRCTGIECDKIDCQKYKEAKDYETMRLATLSSPIATSTQQQTKREEP